MTDTAVREAPAPDRAYARAPGLRGEFTRLMDLMPDALAGRLTAVQHREYLLCRAAVKDRTALIAILSDADRDFAKAAAAEALWHHDEQHATRRTEVPPDAAGGECWSDGSHGRNRDHARSQEVPVGIA